MQKARECIEKHRESLAHTIARALDEVATNAKAEEREAIAREFDETANELNGEHEKLRKDGLVFMGVRLLDRIENCRRIATAIRARD